MEQSGLTSLKDLNVYTFIDELMSMLVERQFINYR